MRLFLLLLLALSAVPAQAQVTGSGVEGVRQRIQALRGQPQRVVQPVVVFVTPPAQPAAPAPLSAEDRQALERVRPGLADRVQSYFDMYRSGAPPVIVNLGPDALAGITGRDTVVVRDSSGATIVPPPRPSGVAPLPRASVPSVREVERAILETGLFRAAGVHFEFDRSTLLSGSEVFIDPVGEVLQQHPELRVEVSGHTDSIGSEVYNERLSQARAETVRQYLIERFGLDPSRLVARGYGESRPIVTNDNPTGRAINRRVEFTVLDR